MTDERLEELISYVDKLSVNNHVELHLLCDLQAVCRELIEQNRRAVSGDVQEAIQILHDIYPSPKQIATGEYPHVAEAIDIAITALQAYKEPCARKALDKPEYIGGFLTFSACGNCDANIFPNDHYCPNCGCPLQEAGENE